MGCHDRHRASLDRTEQGGCPHMSMSQTKPGFPPVQRKQGWAPSFVEKLRWASPTLSSWWSWLRQRFLRAARKCRQRARLVLRSVHGLDRFGVAGEPRRLRTVTVSRADLVFLKAVAHQFYSDRTPTGVGISFGVIA